MSPGLSLGQDYKYTLDATERVVKSLTGLGAP